MTVHKSQGSQFGTAAVVLPAAGLAHPDARAALHGGHARARAAHHRRHRGGGARRRGPPGRTRVRPAPPPVGRQRLALTESTGGSLVAASDQIAPASPEPKTSPEVAPK